MMSDSLGCYTGARIQPSSPIPFVKIQRLPGEGGVSLAAPQTSSLLPPPTGLNLWIRHCIGSILVTHTCMHIRYKNTFYKDNTLIIHIVRLHNLVHEYSTPGRPYCCTLEVSNS